MRDRLDSDIDLLILKVLEINGENSMQRISELLRFSESECVSALGHLVTDGYVTRSGEKFKITSSGKQRLRVARLLIEGDSSCLLVDLFHKTKESLTFVMLSYRMLKGEIWIMYSISKAGSFNSLRAILRTSLHHVRNTESVPDFLQDLVAAKLVATIR
jgi:DNA-binding Lrp family transcriptional regulator